jgi:tRNA (guanosine-2'-O-)-methyltransferase
MTENGRPITPRRLARMRGTLVRRQPDLTVVVENVHDPHNVSAILRSCDAVGAASAHLVYSREERPELSKGVAASAQRWIDLHNHETAAECYSVLRESGFRIYATSLTHESRDLYDLDLTAPTAFVFGNESRGVTPGAAALADDTVYIPMMGMVESLNVSVACAVALYEAMRQRLAAGTYLSESWPPDEIERRLRAWLIREDRDPEAAASEVTIEMPKARNRYLHREP